MTKKTVKKQNVKHTSKAAKAETKTATKTEDADDDKSTALAISVAPGAIQKGLGAQILSIMAADVDTLAEADALKVKAKYYRQEAVSRLVSGVFEICKADENIDPVAVFGKPKDWKQTLQQIYVAMELRNPDGSYTKDALKFMPDPNASDAAKETAEYKRRKSLRDNLATSIKKAAKVVVALIDKNMSIEMDDERHTAIVHNAPKLIAGKAGASVYMDDTTPAGAKESASFASIQKMAEQKHGTPKQEKPGKASDVASAAHAAATSEEDFGALVNTMIAAINAVSDNITPKRRKHLEGLWDVLSNVLENAKDAA